MYQKDLRRRVVSPFSLVCNGCAIYETRALVRDSPRLPNRSEGLDRRSHSGSQTRLGFFWFPATKSKSPSPSTVAEPNGIASRARQSSGLGVPTFQPTSFMNRLSIRRFASISAASRMSTGTQSSENSLRSVRNSTPS